MERFEAFLAVMQICTWSKHTNIQTENQCISYSKIILQLRRIGVYKIVAFYSFSSSLPPTFTFMSHFPLIAVSPILQAAYKEALDKHGSVSVDIMQCIFVGPSAVGKSTLKHVLVHNTPKAAKTSTAVMATPEVVTITSEQYAVEGGTSAWQLVSNDVMGKSLRACINTRAFDDITQYPSEAEVNRTDQAKQESYALEQGDALPRSPPAIPVHQQQRSNSTQTQAGTTEESVAQVSPIAVLDLQHSQLLQEMGGDGERIQLNNASFVHLLDTGGQPSFQDALPLLLDVPCTYIQVFNAAQDLDQPVPITYRRDEHTEESLPANEETGWEMMLRSFSSMHTMAHKCSRELATFQQEESQLPQLRIFVVGTFKDQLVEEGRRESVVRDICRLLRGLKGKPYYQSFKWDGSQPFYLINGISVAGEEKVCINNLRKHLSSGGSALKLNVPVMWYVCQQITQRVPLKFFKFNDLMDFCLKHQFIEANNADSQFRSLLKLFSLLGFYAFFNLKDVPDEANFVCTDRGVFLKEVSKLLAVQFAATRSPAMERLKDTGVLIFNLELFQELGISQEMDLHWFLNSLCYLGIAARLPTKERAEYFIPAVLPQKAVHQTPSGSVVPLCFTYRIKEGAVFAYNDLPQGLFCRLAVDLIRQEWKIIENQCTRTLLKFRWKEFEIFLQECLGYISLIPQVVEEFPTVSELHAGCLGLCRTVTVCLSHSTEDALGSHFGTVAELVVGFECPCTEVSVPHLALPSSTGKSLTCSETSSCQVHTKQQRIWFSTVDSATVSSACISSDCSGWLCNESRFTVYRCVFCTVFQLKFFQHSNFWSLEESACREKLPEASDAILSQMVYGELLSCGTQGRNASVKTLFLCRLPWVSHAVQKACEQKSCRQGEGSS